MDKWATLNTGIVHSKAKSKLKVRNACYPYNNITKSMPNKESLNWLKNQQNKMSEVAVNS